ncbi:MAG: hypothetical protein FWD36_05165 [Treponema sp.]|nr:hypothetical protein [Treponema sp.]
MVFFLRFRSQLQRIRPELVLHLDEVAVRAIKEAGGKITEERGLIRAVFDDSALGFWLDTLMLIETLKQAAEDAAIDLYGYSLVIGKTLPDVPHPLYRFLAGKTGGIFIDRTATKALQPYITITEQEQWTAKALNHSPEPFSRLKELKIFIPTARPDSLLQEANIRLLELGQQPAVFIANRSFEGKRDKLYLRIAGFSTTGDADSFFPLFIRFGNRGLNALTDSWAQWMRLSAPFAKSDALKAHWEFLFRERIKDKPSLFAIRMACRFFTLLLDQYCNVAYIKSKTPAIIIENIQAAEKTTADIVIEALRRRQNLLLLGTCTGEIDNAGMEQWSVLFPQLTSVTGEQIPNDKIPELPPDLWEIAYTCSLLGQYFPPDLIPQLLKEMGKNPLMISRAFSLLHTFRIFDTPLDPRPWHSDFQSRAEIRLGERTNTIRETVRSRLLAWVAQHKINPCLRLLKILKSLNNTMDIDNDLILQSIQCELAGMDEMAIRHIHYDKLPETIAGPVRGPIIRYILETMLAIHSDNTKNIHAAFANPPPDCSAFPLLKAKVLINQSLYYLGTLKNDAAMEAVKESTLLCKKNDNLCLAQSYRLFALANLLQRRIGEALDYLGFALENAAKLGWFQEIGMSTYYAASVQLLYGNLSRARTLAEKSRRHFIKAGNPEWADRARFLEGRLAFEIGSYRQAITIFEDILQNPEGDHSPEKESLLAAWTYRAKVFCQSFLGAKPLNGGRDADLFEIEAMSFAGNYAKVMELSGIFSAASVTEDFLPIERPDWRSGFAQCELLYFSWNDLRERILCAYQALAGSEEAIRTMRRLLRSGQFPEIDPCDTFYHYVWHRVLEQTGASQVDINTAVSVAFKRLQSRAGRIDDMEIRRQYLTQPRWNQTLGQAAKDFKLV